jgi:hypothetical protein
VAGRRVGMLTSCDRAPAAMRNTSHGWLRCCATGPGQYKDGKEKILSTRLFLVLPPLVNTAPSLVFHAVLSSGCGQGGRASGGAQGLATVHSEAAEATKRVSSLGDKLVIMR